MKTLFFGIVLILLIGFAGFFYRNVAERTGLPDQVACTMEAKICPDGSSVGRVGPNCEFAECPSGTVTVNAEISFTPPAGYTRNDALPNEENKTIVHQYEKNSLSDTPHHIINLQQLGIDGDAEIEDDIVTNTILYPSDMQVESIDKFEKVVIGGKTFYGIVIERFEAIVHSAYYLPVTRDGFTNLYRFDVIEHDVTDWMEPGLVVKDLPEHKVLLEMLSSIEIVP